MGFVNFGRSSNGVDPIVNSHTQPSGHFTGCTKKPKTKQQTEGGKKKQTNTDLELQMQESGVGTLAFYVCSWLSRELSKNPTQLPKMQTHLVIILTFQLPASESQSQLTNPLPWSLTLAWQPLSISSILTGFRGHSSLCGLCANIDKERSSGHSSAASKMPEIKSPPWPLIHEHTERPTHIHSYIYIYTHTH